MGTSILAKAAENIAATSVGTAFPLLIDRSAASYTKLNTGLTVQETVYSGKLYGIIIQFNASSKRMLSTFGLHDDANIHTMVISAPLSGFSPSIYALCAAETDSSGSAAAHQSFRVSRTAIQLVTDSTINNAMKYGVVSTLYVIPA